NVQWAGEPPAGHAGVGSCIASHPNRRSVEGTRYRYIFCSCRLSFFCTEWRRVFKLSIIMIHALIIAGFSVFGFHTPADSLGTETVEGKVYILHRVEEKETLYGISRRYGATIESILDANPSADAGLDIGQILKVPYTGQRPRTYTRQTGAGGIHRVEEKETLFSISRLYGISVDELKLWNRLSSSDLNVGQELVIRQIDTSTPANDPPAAPPLIKKGVHEVKAGESMYAIARQYGVSLEDIKRWNNLEDNALKAGQLLFVSPPARDTEQTPVAE